MTAPSRWWRDAPPMIGPHHWACPQRPCLCAVVVTAVRLPWRDGLRAVRAAAREVGFLSEELYVQQDAPVWHTVIDRERGGW